MLRICGSNKRIPFCMHFLHSLETVSGVFGKQSFLDAKTIVLYYPLFAASHRKLEHFGAQLWLFPVVESGKNYY